MRGDLENVIVFLILALLGGGIQAVKAWLDKKQETPAQNKSDNAADIGDATGDTDAAKEAKMRRFMEALGLPADEVLPPQRPAPQPPSDSERSGSVRSDSARGESAHREPPSAHPMGPGPHPWATTKLPIPAPAGEGSYEERMAARRRELEKLKEARAERKRAAQAQARAAAPPPQSKPEASPRPTIQETAPLDEAAPAQYTFDVASLGEQAPSLKLRTEKRPTSQGTSIDAAPLRERLRNPAELRRAFVLKEILGRPKALEALEERPA